MNREIKFKAWDGRRMIYDGDDMGMYGARVMHGSIWYYDESGDQFYWRECNGDYVFMQWTGLKDCKGTDIYEGDIVRSKSHGKTAFLIEFIEGGFCATNPDIKGYPIDINHFYPSADTDIEVIGNIHQNKNLLP